jgi:hypothetical protein
MELDYDRKLTRPVTYVELLRFVNDEGGSSFGTAAMIAYYWLQHEEGVLTRLRWSHYRLADNLDIANVFHHKTGKDVDIPLYDETERPFGPS